MESESELESKKESFFDSQCLISGSGRKNCNSWFPIFKRLQKKRPYRISFPFSGMWRHVQRKLDVLHDSDGDAVHHHHLQVPIRHLLPPPQLRHLRCEWWQHSNFENIFYCEDWTALLSTQWNEFRREKWNGATRNHLNVVKHSEGYFSQLNVTTMPRGWLLILLAFVTRLWIFHT